MTCKKVLLKDIADDIQTGPFGSQLHQSDYSDYGIPVIMPKDLLNGHISTNTIALVEPCHAERLNRHLVKTDDIVFARRGDVGRCAFVTEKESGWICGTGCIRVRINSNLTNPKFVFYQLQKEETIGWIEKHAVGATMLNLNTSIIGDVPVELPDLSTQNKIVEIISNYDKLIENNQKQIKLLEEAAQRLYKEWFVDLRFPGYENTKIVDGVPEGWRKVSVTDLLDIKYGKDHKKLENGDIPVYGSGGVMRKVNKLLYSGESVLIPRKGSLNNIMYVSGDFWTIDTMFYSVPKLESISKLVYLFLKTLDMYSYNIGAAVPSMTVNILSGIYLCVPDDVLLNVFEDSISSYFKMIYYLNKQIELTAKSRDMLLPRLMSGEVEV